MSSTERAPRYHALDGLRAFAMLLGVFLHAAVPYLHVNFPWAVVDGSRSYTLTLVVYAIHSFRMPAFFLIAGFFARLVYLRAGLGPFVRHRSQRILLPLVAGWLVLHPIVRALWVYSGIRTIPGSDSDDFLSALSTVFSAEFITRGLSLMHLWFLYYLLVLYAAFLCVRWVFDRIDQRRKLRKILDRAFVRVAGAPWAALALALPTTAVLLLMHGWGVDFVTRSLLPRPAHILFYGLFFTLGWLLHRNPSSLAALRARWPIHLAAGTLLFAPLIVCLYSIYVLRHPTGTLFRVSYFLMYAAMAWSFVLGLLGAFERFFDKPSAAWRYLADSSYWVYLVHLPIVIFASILLREVQAVWYVKLAVVLTASTPVLLGSYQVLVRSTWIGVVLNGRRLPFWKATP